MSNGKLFLIDGHALVFKMFYAFMRRPMINTKGQDMSILFGFTKYLLELIEREKPTHLAVAFDPPGGTFRNKMFEAYKANRPPTPPLIIAALEPLTEIVQALNIPVLMIKGFEADDVIGSMAKRSAKEGFDVYMVTPDKDYGQLIEEHIFQIKPGKAGSDDEILGVPEICQRYGICDPKQVIDMLAICGDAADNVPGVKGVGEVGATKLIGKYGSLENIYEHIGELSTKQGAMFEAAKDHIQLSKELVTIKTDIALETTAEDMKLDTDYSPRIVELFNEYEFGSLKRYISHVNYTKADQPAVEEKKTELSVVKTTPEEVVLAAMQSGKCSIVFETSLKSIFADPGFITVSARRKETFLVAEGTVSQFKMLLEDASVEKYGYDLKFKSNVLHNSGVELAGKFFDIPLLHYLVDPERSHNLDALASTYLGVSMEEQAPETQKAAPASLFDMSEEEESKKDFSKEASVLIPLAEKIVEELKTSGAYNLYETMEEPLLKVLGRMECNGVKVDMASLREFAGMLSKSVVEREEKIKELAGDPNLNPASPKQIGAVIFEKLIPENKAKKTASGTWSTDEQTLLDYADQNPIIDELLEYRGEKKLLSTYIEPFGGFISPVTGKVHTTYNQALTATGRLSSSNPNLQNIPIRTDLGKNIRKAFVPSTPDGVILSADYSQIELRIMAHLSCDQHLISSFRQGIDVHQATAAKVFGIPNEEVTPDQRRIAKTANFGIMYGISSFGLAQRLRIGRKEAKKIIDDYFASFPSIKSFISDTLEALKENGYVETLFGRRRYVPDINSKNANIRAAAERNAVNAPIQGTSADIIKLAMIAVDKRIREEGLKSKMVLQIHDELVFDAPASEVDRLKEIVVSEMEHVIELSVPLTVECNYGTNWLEAH